MGRSFWMLVGCNLLFISFSFIFGFADDIRKVSLFYPSPYGEYEELRSKRIVVGGKSGGQDFMDPTQISGQDGVVVISDGLVVGGYSSGSDYLSDAVGDVRVKVLAELGEVNSTSTSDRLMYKQDGAFLIGDFSSSYSCSSCKMSVKRENALFSVAEKEGISGAVASEGEDVDGASSFGVFGMKDSASVLLLKGGEAGIVVQGGGGVNDFGDYPRIVGQPDKRMEVRAEFVHIGKDEGGSGSSNDMLYVETYPDEVAAIGWGTDGQRYGFLGLNTATRSVRLGAVNVSSGGTYDKLEITANGELGVMIDAKGKVCAGGCKEPTARFMVEGDLSDEDLVRFSGGDTEFSIVSGGVILMKAGDVEVNTSSSGITVNKDDPGTYEGQEVILDADGYAAVKDIYLSEPKHGSPRWASDLPDLASLLEIEVHDGIGSCTCPSDMIRVGCSGGRHPGLVDTCPEERCGYIGTKPVGTNGCATAIDGDTGTAPAVWCFCLKRKDS